MLLIQNIGRLSSFSTISTVGRTESASMKDHEYIAGPNGLTIPAGQLVKGDVIRLTCVSGEPLRLTPSKAGEPGKEEARTAVAEIERVRIGVDRWPVRCACGAQRWVPYYLIPGAPAAGCNNCGHIIYLTHEMWEIIRGGK